MEITDDRNADQKQTHTCLIAGTDSFLSGWGKASGGTSYAAWACKPEHARPVRDWVESRGDMKRVREVSTNWKPTGNGHAHIYAVDDQHPALASLARCGML